MKKAAEVDFTWAASLEPIKIEVLAGASHGRIDVPAKWLENLGHRLYCSRAFQSTIMIVLTAKQTTAIGQRRSRRGPFGGG